MSELLLSFGLLAFILGAFVSFIAFFRPEGGDDE